MVFEEFVLTKELGIRQCGLPTSEEHDSPEEFDTQISDRCCAICQLSKNIYPPNGHIIEGHLCLIMSLFSLGYKWLPPTTTSWLATPRETDACHLRASHPPRTLSENHQVRKTQTQTPTTQSDWASLKRLILRGSDACSFEDCASSRRLGVMV